MRLDKLRAHGSLPRFGSQPSFVHPVTGEPNANLCQPREEFDEARTFFVFISHRWWSEDHPEAVCGCVRARCVRVRVRGPRLDPP